MFDSAKAGKEIAVLRKSMGLTQEGSWQAG